MPENIQQFVKKIPHSQGAAYVLMWDIDQYSADRIFRSIRLDLVEQNSVQATLHMPSVTYLNSTSIGYLVDLYSCLCVQGGNLILNQVSDTLLESLEMIGLGDVFEFSSVSPAAL